MKWFKISLDGAEIKMSMTRNLIVKFVSIMAKYDTSSEFVLYHKFSELHTSEIYSYYFTCPDEISNKMASSFSDFSISEIEPIDKNQLFKVLGN